MTRTPKKGTLSFLLKRVFNNIALARRRKELFHCVEFIRILKAATGLEKSATIRPFATKKSRLASEKILLVDSLATESCCLVDRLATKPFFFQSGQRLCGLNIIARCVALSLRWSKTQAVRRSHLRVDLPTSRVLMHSCQHVQLLLLRSSNGADEQSHAFRLSVCMALQPSTRVFFARLVFFFFFFFCFSLNLSIWQLKLQLYCHCGD